MGTDIHPMVEGKNENGDWVCIHPVRKPFRGYPICIESICEFRNYLFFYYLGGVKPEKFSVRGISLLDKVPEMAIQTPNGLPVGVSSEILEFFSQGYYEDIGHIKYDDYCKLWDMCKHEINWEFHKTPSPVKVYVEQFLGPDFRHHKDLRVVFGFDS